MTNDSAESLPPTPDEVWLARVLCAANYLETNGVLITPTHLKEMVGATFASYFAPKDRLYEGARPSWETRVDEATGVLVTRRLLRRPTSKAQPGADATPHVTVTARGRSQVEGACRRGETVTEADRSVAGPAPARSGLLPPGVVTAPLQDKLRPSDSVQGVTTVVDTTRTFRHADDTGDADGRLFDDEPEAVMIELNLRYGVGAEPAPSSGTMGAIERVRQLWQLVGARGEPEVVAEQYLAGDLTTRQVQNIVTADSAGGEWPLRAIFRIWPDFEVHRQIDGSCTTIKALPAQRSFAAFGDGIVWGVVDSGIDGSHPHFLGEHTLDDPAVADLHRDFVSGSTDPAQALIDDDGHGTHVAGIIAGGLQRWKRDDVSRHAIAAERRKNNGAVGGDDPIVMPRTVDIDQMIGMAPHAKLVSLKVLGGLGDVTARTARVMKALAYVREENAKSAKVIRIHGVNLSLGYDFLADWFACGQSPLCLEVNRLVLSGVVVVVAAGNSGYVKLNPKLSDVAQFSAGITINDPGNAELAITVGSTHRDSPHTNGISYFSSRGPTGDGRPKPDLVAPGERIMSAAAGQNLKAIARARLPQFDGAAAYIEDSGTSMAAPHVSGAIAAFLSVQREYVGRPAEVKRIFMASATSLNRDPNFQGAGLVDLMRALQTP